MRSRSLLPRMSAVIVLAKEECREVLSGPMVYVWCSGGPLLAAFVVQTYLQSLQGMGLAIYEDPLKYPFVLSMLVSGFYFAVWASTRIARERESGTLEVLYWTPLDDLELACGKILGSALAALLCLLWTLCFFAITSWLTTLAFPLYAAPCLLSSSIFLVAMIALGTFISSVASRLRTAIALLAVTILAFLGLQASVGFLGRLAAEQLSRPLLLMRDSANWLSTIVGVVSPFHYLTASLEALSGGTAGVYGVTALGAVGNCAALIVACVVALKLKGIRK